MFETKNNFPKSLLEKHVFQIVIIYRGHQWKGTAIYHATKVNLKQKKTFELMDQNVFFNTLINL
jgi:hypothetical protein